MQNFVGETLICVGVQKTVAPCWTLRFCAGKSSVPSNPLRLVEPLQLQTASTSQQPGTNTESDSTSRDRASAKKHDDRKGDEDDRPRQVGDLPEDIVTERLMVSNKSRRNEKGSANVEWIEKTAEVVQLAGK